ncbi:hypothetical protein C8R45DRAFT_1072545 [Mycena sanguinolenta]|nr:hypothetical protein C8R45DRAFT_1072545 [Mycena sanguinolenta]
MYIEVDESLRELTGTFPFLSIELLEKKQAKHQSYHDLESFYWLFVWIILRYTDHTHERRDFACHILFDAEEPEASKRNWLLKPTPLADSPLYKVTEALRSLVMHQNHIIAEETVPHPSRPPLPAPEPAFINFEYVKWAFDLVIKAPIWTNFQDSPAKVFHPPCKKKAGPSMLNYPYRSSRTQWSSAGSSGLSQTGSTSSKRRHEAGLILLTSPAPIASSSNSSGHNESED